MSDDGGVVAEQVSEAVGDLFAELDGLTNPARSGDDRDPRVRFLSRAQKGAEQVAKAAEGVRSGDVEAQAGAGEQQGVTGGEDFREVALNNGQKIKVPAHLAGVIESQEAQLRAFQARTDQMNAQVAKILASQGQNEAQQQAKQAPPQQAAVGVSFEKALERIKKVDTDNGMGGELYSAMKDALDGLRGTFQDEVFGTVSEYIADLKGNTEAMRPYVEERQRTETVGREVAAYLAAYPHLDGVLDAGTLVADVAQTEAAARASGLNVSRETIIAVAVNKRMAEALKGIKAAPAGETATNKVSAGRSYTDQVVSAAMVAPSGAGHNGASRPGGTKRPSTLNELFGFGS